MSKTVSDMLKLSEEVRSKGKSQSRTKSVMNTKNEAFYFTSLEISEDVKKLSAISTNL
ncbi:hypothetical protein A5819_001749 [Enterococcus sp. 7E2_DIV0204]|uniref:Uncharacterized protein n=1 Tax=Candidatus Enterococcus lemimoniae TaxID=1834167 RepID=A0ABZ2T5Q1_9ENTE|nr:MULTISPECIES: hypothetical protein [unclassified Enterococcus]OTN89257.1 hypothetical protein A5819_001749 [Enterococcus sp. 7E2_DIV0204]OTO68104.1 hypothetical protein A5866_000299 [Enterococcus sp. 12C11_DIV0727]OTP51703.1 hypothetical protein A5884_000898 [Enterococcus sp. 7D2_DIV0200]